LDGERNESDDVSMLDRFLAENNFSRGGFNMPDSGASCNPSHTVHCVPGTCTKTEIIVMLE
jgi:hypothetical protein